MMKALKTLLGGTGTPKNGSSGKSDVQHEEDYNGFHIAVAPKKEGGQYRVGARIYRPEQPEKVHHLVRADLYPSLDIAVDQTLAKARQAVDQLGDRMFR